MVAIASISPARRERPRVPVSGFCSEHDDETERHSVILDLSADGLRVQRPVGGRRSRVLQLEFEIPGVDELMWAKGVICFDQLWCVEAANMGDLSGMLRTSGIQIVAAAERHKRLLREYVTDTYYAKQANDDHIADTEWMYRSSHFMRG